MCKFDLIYGNFHHFLKRNVPTLQLLIKIMRSLSNPSAKFRKADIHSFTQFSDHIDVVIFHLHQRSIIINPTIDKYKLPSLKLTATEVKK